MNEKTKQLFEIDLKFCEESQSIGHEAWEKYLSENVILGGGPNEPYLDDRNQMMTSLVKFYKLEDLHFSWEPRYAFISDDETLGVTTGVYKRSFKVEGEVREQSGKYTTTWKKIDGEWKIVLDIGN